jgi:tryptophanyl-tRNA synthetase
MHSITVPQDPEELKKHILDVAALYLAVGLDPEKSIVFVQSEVSGHAELSWILTCNSYTGELSRMTQFKSKSRGQESAPTGLFTYPILMAADILLYDTNIVPVGNDQKQHIELCRDIALRVNHKYGEDTFVVPDGQYMKEGARIMSLDDPSNKMSKSAENEMSRISLLDDEKEIKKAIMRATTDSDMTIRFDPENKPGVSNLLTIYGALTGTSVADLEAKFDGAGYGDLKKSLVTVVTESLAPIQDRFNEIRYSDELLDILRDGSKRANEIAEPVLERVKGKFGLGL